MKASNTIEYHLQSMRSAKVLEWLGGAKAVDSTMFSRAVCKLLNDHAMTEAQIVGAYREKFPPSQENANA